MTNAIPRGKPYAENPHVRFDERDVASEKPRRGSLLCRTLAVCLVCLVSGTMVALAADVPWVFEGSTNRVAASSAGAAVRNLVRSEFSEMLSLPTELQVKMGFAIFLR